MVDIEDERSQVLDDKHSRVLGDEHDCALEDKGADKRTGGRNTPRTNMAF